MTLLKPLSAAIAIGTGGPFGAEGPIIATGGALGSLLGQVLAVTAAERKTLLAAGAAAGMAATFGSPISAVLLAVELLLFEYRPRSLIPVALAASVAAAVRTVSVGIAPVFAMPDVAPPSAAALAVYVLLGGLLGGAAVLVTRLVYAIEDNFERLPIHFMWWPAIGGLVVGAVGFISPHTLGVGYDNIERLLSGDALVSAAIALCACKLVSWSIALGSGTSGGTLAPLFTIGAGCGAVIGSLLAHSVPSLGVDVRMAALVGMAALFAGASRAVLASVVFAFETTRQPLGLLPLLGGCSAAFLVSCLMMRHSIMTEKIARRGVRVIGEYTADFLEQLRVADCALRKVETLRGTASVADVQAWLASGAAGSSHQGFPILDCNDQLIGVLTRRDLFAPRAHGTQLAALIRREPVVSYSDWSLRDAADQMAREHIGRLPVVRRAQPRKVIGIITRSDLIEVHARRLAAHALRPKRGSAGVDASRARAGASKAS
jgi:H+/Cl- antiporter ClcA